MRYASVGPSSKFRRKKPKRVRGFNDDEDDYRTEFAELCPGETESQPK
jgi:hypothetical protein